jgi:hypothetical protein
MFFISSEFRFHSEVFLVVLYTGTPLVLRICHRLTRSHLFSLFCDEKHHGELLVHHLWSWPCSSSLRARRRRPCATTAWTPHPGAPSAPGALWQGSANVAGVAVRPPVM